MDGLIDLRPELELIRAALLALQEKILSFEREYRPAELHRSPLTVEEWPSLKQRLN